MKKRIAATVSFFLIVLFLRWYAGYNVLERSELNCFWVMCDLIFAGFVYFCPCWGE